MGCEKDFKGAVSCFIDLVLFVLLFYCSIVQLNIHGILGLGLRNISRSYVLLHRFGTFCSIVYLNIHGIQGWGLSKSLRKLCFASEIWYFLFYCSFK